MSERSRHSNLQLFNPHLTLRLFEKREIGDFAESNVTVNFQGLFSLFNHYAQSFFADAWILVVDLGHAFIGGRGDFSIDLQPLHYELDGPVTIAANIAVGFDAGFDHALDFIGLLLDFFYTGYQTRLGEDEDVLGPGKNIEPLLLRLGIQEGEQAWSHRSSPG